MLCYSDEQNQLAERFNAGDRIRYEGRLGTFICPRGGFQGVGDDEPRRLALVHIIGDDRCSVVAADELEPVH